MFCTRQLIFAAAIACQVAALPAADPKDDASECSSSWSAYESSSLEYEEPYATSIISTTVYDVRSWSYGQPITTLCDGHPRGNGPWAITSVPETSTLDPPETTVLYSAYPSDPPTCATAQYPDAPDQTSSPDSDLSPRDEPVACGGSCYIYAQPNPRLYYWPVTTVSGDFCAQNGSTVFASPTSPPEPNKAVVDGYTLTSPTNYLSFYGVQAYNHGQRPRMTACGPSKDHVFLPITESFYSGQYKGVNNGYSFNFADLNTVPVEAWTRQRRCGYAHTACGKAPIVQTEYTPILPLPTEVLNLEPEEWKAAGCRGEVEGFYVIPVALATPTPTVVKKLLL
jgi:hypothetical protein